MRKRITRQVKVGDLSIGGGAPVVIQSMTKTDTRDIGATVREIKRLEKAGCELIRVAVKDIESARAISRIKRKISIPLVADIHFDIRLALEALDAGADKIRVNPGNMRRRGDIIELARQAKRRRIPVRVGVNSGSVKKSFPGSKGEVSAAGLIGSAMDFISVLEDEGFYDIVVSLKASSIKTTVEAYRMFSKKSIYPLHLGVTAAGPLYPALIKSSIGIGVLLLEGIGDTIRVSLTDDSINEVMAARAILQALGLRRFTPEIVSCPTCGRCQVDLRSIVRQFERRITHYVLHTTQEHWPSVAIMGCEVNGPGEARGADIGVAFGKGSGALFKDGRIIRRIKEKDAVKELLNYCVKNKKKRRRR